jgi:hypothetical protein
VWWKGRRFDKPIAAWAGSETNEVTRDGVQRLLVGPPKIEAEWGTGLVPGDDLLDWARRQGVPDALDGIVVQHWRNVANDAVDGAHSAASIVPRVVALKRTTMRGAVHGRG